MPKSTVEEIRARFDADVERFSDLQTGQLAAIDSTLCLELIAQAAKAVSPHAKSLLDIGCGAGNYTLKLLQELPHCDCTLVDLSLPMLERARARVSAATTGQVETVQGDIREIELGETRFDAIVAAAVLHHLRSEAEWLDTFRKFHRALRSGGSLWVFDMVEHSLPGVQKLMYGRYGHYLKEQGGAAYRDKVFDYIAVEDTPATLMQQLDWLRATGFETVEVLHKNSCFAAFGAVKN